MESRDTHRPAEPARAAGPVVGNARLLQAQGLVGNRAVAAWVQASRPPCPGCGGCSCGKEGQAGRRPNGPDASGLPGVGLQRSIGQWFEEGVLAVESGLGVAGADCKLAVDRERDYIEDGVRGPEDLQAPTGIGGFGAQYDPAYDHP